MWSLLCRGALPSDGVAVQADGGMRSPPVAPPVRMPQLWSKVQDSSVVDRGNLSKVFYDVCSDGRVPKAYCLNKLGDSCASDRIQQLQQQIEAWQVLLEKLGGMNSE